jgi:hypothetical protein
MIDSHKNYIEGEIYRGASENSEYMGEEKVNTKCNVRFIPGRAKGEFSV